MKEILMDSKLLYAGAFGVLGLVCWPSPRWQRLLLGAIALFARLGVLGALAGLAATALWPDSMPSALPTLLQAAAERHGLGASMYCLLMALLVACAAVPVLAGLDFARTLADNRSVTSALRAALHVLRQYGTSVDPAVIPPAFPAAAYRNGANLNNNSRRLGDLVND